LITVNRAARGQGQHAAIQGASMRQSAVIRTFGVLSLAMLCCQCRPAAAALPGTSDSNPFRIGGYVSVRQQHAHLNRDGADYQTAYAALPQRATLDRTITTLKLDAGARGRSWAFYGRAHLDQDEDQIEHTSERRFDELHFAWTPRTDLKISAGKIVLNWGQGYLWNPASFVERPKDPTDPRQAREGYTMVTADYTQHVSEDTEIVYSPVLLPASAEINDGFGDLHHLNLAGRLLVRHAHAEGAFQFLRGGSRSSRYGYTFAVSLTPQLELHGEWARISAQDFRYASPTGTAFQRREPVTSYVAGAHYRPDGPVHLTVEYYHNGTGYSGAEFSDYAQLAENAAIAGPSSALMARAERLAAAGFGRQQSMRNYLYLRVSPPISAGRGRIVPSLRTTLNLDDGSRSITPELFYNSRGPWSLRARITRYCGGSGAEYGERRYTTRSELRLHVHF